MWKLSQNKVQGYSINFSHNPRRGWLADVHPICSHAPAAVRRAREASLKVKGSRLFNLVPKTIRDMTGTVDQFKAELDRWLSSIPDQPTIADRQRAAQSNSLLHQAMMQH